MACFDYKHNVVATTVLLIGVCFFCSSARGFNHRIPVDQVEERECVGTNNGFSTSGSPEFQYNLLRRRYQGCTYVLGNLELSNLNDQNIKYDLSFLKDIRYVSGYVLIALVGEVSEIPLQSLEIIRGNSTYLFREEEYSLMVSLTSRQRSPEIGVKTLMLPKLKEITNGKVSFLHNPSLGFIDTINWDPILRGGLNSVHFGPNPYNISASNGSDIDYCHGGGMWGPDSTLCQEVVLAPPTCDESCGFHCYGDGPGECCHETCAIGCVGPSARECRFCKDFENDGDCVPYCPELTYQLSQNCVKYTPLNLD